MEKKSLIGCERNSVALSDFISHYKSGFLYENWFIVQYINLYLSLWIEFFLTVLSKVN